VLTVCLSYHSSNSGLTVRTGRSGESTTSNSHSARKLLSCYAVGLGEGSIAMKKFCQDWFEFWTHPGRHRRGPRDTDWLEKVSHVCGRPWDIYFAWPSPQDKQCTDDFPESNFQTDAYHLSPPRRPQHLPQTTKAHYNMPHGHAEYYPM
jgi:hypothetical protein